MKTIPLSVSLLVGGIAILVITFGLKYAWSSVKTTAVGQGISLGNDALGSMIRNWRSQAMTETDPHKIAGLMNNIAAAEGERGRMVSAGTGR